MDVVDTRIRSDKYTYDEIVGVYSGLFVARDPVRIDDETIKQYVGMAERILDRKKGR